MSDLSARVLELITSGQATTRTELATCLGAAPSTVSLVVVGLIERGLVSEEGTRASTGGRPRKVLTAGGTNEYAIAADLGGDHARTGIVLAGGVVDDVTNVPFTMTDGPEQGLERLAALLQPLVDRRGSTGLRGVGLSLPGPVDSDAGVVRQPSRMPGWSGFPVGAWLQERFGVPCAVENDANCMAIGEQAVQPPERRQTIMVKAGSAIGAGIIADGRLYRGATGAAGDITHVRIDGAGDTPCSCGNTGCLETVASGAALVRILRERGVRMPDGSEISGTSDVVRLAADSEPETMLAVRQAGKFLGEVLAANVNFFNPDAVSLGGSLSTLEPFVAAVRSQLYEGCHPLVTRHLVIEQASLGANAGLVGAGQFALQRSLTAALTTETNHQRNDRIITIAH